VLSDSGGTDNLADIIKEFTCRQLALFCRIVVLLIYEPEESKTGDKRIFLLCITITSFSFLYLLNTVVHFERHGEVITCSAATASRIG
jgi:hypothetical protein